MAEFFEEKGLAALKEEDRAETWYSDWIEYQGRHGLYASVLSPRTGAAGAGSFDLLRLTRFWEACAYFSPAHAYSLHVSFLGLHPILRSGNESLRKEALAKLAAGGLFGFGVSERSHGADLLGNEFTVSEAATTPDRLVARGSKYYIGNANVAAMLSVLARRARPGPAGASRRAPFLLLAIRPTEPGAVRSVRKIRTFGVRTAFVGAFDVDHEFPASDVISTGREAWESVLATVTLGKLFLCFGSIGVCEHALEEARAHVQNRILYGKPVADLPHIRTAMCHAYARLTGMKLFAYRALDYLHAAHADDRRYLLFAAVQKATVSSEAVRVMALLLECVGAKGFESDTYFETALRDVPLVPILEGSAHINHQAVAQFLPRYFARRSLEAPGMPDPPSLTAAGASAGGNAYVMELSPGDERSVRFGHFLKAYRPLRQVRNVRIFVRQLRAFRSCLRRSELGAVPKQDVELNIALGKCLSVVVYAQLVAEHCAIAGVAKELVSVLFHQSIEALTAEALHLASRPASGPAARALLARVTAVPQTSQTDVDLVDTALREIGARA